MLSAAGSAEASLLQSGGGLTPRTFRVNPEALDALLGQAAEELGFDVSRGLEESGFVPKLRTVVEWGRGSERIPDMATQVAVFAHFAFVVRGGLEVPEGFAPKSILAEAVASPMKADAVRVSLWAEGAVGKSVSFLPIEVESFKHPAGIPASYAPARWTLEHILGIIVDEANRLVPYALAVAAEARRQESGQ